MKTILKLFCCCALSAALCGCAAGYWRDRGRDAADIFTFAVGNGLGAKARVGPVTAGLLADYTYTGLRGGEWCRQDLSAVDTKYESMDAIDWQYVVDNAERFELAKLERGKNFEASSVGESVKVPLFSMVRSGGSAAYYTQIEAVLGLYVSVRVGFNPGELADFILGFAGIDFFHDDVEMRKARSGPGGHSNEASIAATGLCR